MLELLILTGLVGIGLSFGSSSDDDTNEDPDFADTPQEEPEEIVSSETLTTTLDASTTTFDGTSLNDRVAGNDTANDISGQGGNDFLQGFAGNDTINGGTGTDTIFAGDGDDTAVGGTGNDRVFLGDGDDLYLDENDSTFDRGDDFVRGGRGDDQIADLQGSNALYGDAGNDALLAIGGNAVIPDLSDTLDGGAGDDILFGDNGDLLIGGNGADTFSVIVPSRFEADSVLIDDFNTSEDSFVAFVSEADSPDDQVEFRFDETRNAVVAFWRGSDIAVLNGLTATDIPDIDVSTFDAEDLLRSGLV